MDWVVDESTAIVKCLAHTGICEKNTPPENNTHWKISFQSSKSSAGEQFVLLDCRERAGIKRSGLHSHRHVFIVGPQSRSRSSELLRGGRVSIQRPLVGRRAQVLGRRGGLPQKGARAERGEGGREKGGARVAVAATARSSLPSSSPLPSPSPLLCVLVVVSTRPPDARTITQNAFDACQVSYGETCLRRLAQHRRLCFGIRVRQRRQSSPPRLSPRRPFKGRFSEGRQGRAASV